MMKLRLRTAAAVVLAGLLLAGCDQKSSDAKHIKVGVINGAEQDVAEVAKKVAKEKYGLEVELVGFSGSLLPNEATNAGDLDANVFQHRPFLEQDNKAHGYHLVAVGNTFVFPMAGYSRKIKSVADLQDGATIAIPNDPTNLGRALLLLQKEQLITLKAGTGAAYGGRYYRQPASPEHYGAGRGAAAARAGRPESGCGDYQHHLSAANRALAGA
jgi:D-methionine transport system substrate-binding protein